MLKNLLVIFVSVAALTYFFSPDAGSIDKAAMAAHLDSEVVRLRAHFDSVDRELRDRSTTSLTPAQRSARRQLIEWLREYRDQGQFPLNDIVAYRTPIFRDRRGVLCAMAYLIHRSGRADVVDRIAESRNTAYIRELADDQHLVAWLDSVGLSVAEAARIQPAYEDGGTIIIKDPSPHSQRGLSTGYAVASALISGAALSTGALNLSRPDRTQGILGLATGVGAITTGLVNLDGDGASTTRVAVGNLIAGAAATGLAIHALLSRPDQSAGFAAVQGSRAPARLNVGPGLVPTSNGPQLGLTFRATF